MPKKSKPKLTEKQYAKEGGTRCPFCKSHDISAGRFDGEGQGVNCPVECKTCGKEWCDDYILQGYHQDEPEEDDA